MAEQEFSSEPVTVITQQPSTDRTKKQLPKGLQSVLTAKELIIKQNVDVKSLVLCCCQRPNSYSIYLQDDQDNPIITAREVSQCFARQCMGAGRGISIKFYDGTGEESFGALLRGFYGSRGCCPCTCCLPLVYVNFPHTLHIGVIQERRTCCSPAYDIRDINNQTTMTFNADCCYVKKCLWFHDVDFTVIAKDGEDVARITKQTRKNGAELIGIENNMSIEYLQEDTSFVDKMMVVGAAFLLNLNYFDDEVRYCC